LARSKCDAEVERAEDYGARLVERVDAPKLCQSPSEMVEARCRCDHTGGRSSVRIARVKEARLREHRAADASTPNPQNKDRRVTRPELELASDSDLPGSTVSRLDASWESSSQNSNVDRRRRRGVPAERAAWTRLILPDIVFETLNSIR
jgi:hypothetical protein